MSSFLRYSLFQIPGLLVVGFSLVFAYTENWISLPGCIVVILLWVMKDIALFPVLRKSYERSPHSLTKDFEGHSAIAQGVINPTGHVALRGELWRAELAPGADSIGDRERVRIIEARGLTLIVQAQ